jgi:hypothetical protein
MASGFLRPLTFTLLSIGVRHLSISDCGTLPISHIHCDGSHQFCVERFAADAEKHSSERHSAKQPDSNERRKSGPVCLLDVRASQAYCEFHDSYQDDISTQALECHSVRKVGPSLGIVCPVCRARVDRTSALALKRLPESAMIQAMVTE